MGTSNNEHNGGNAPTTLSQGTTASQIDSLITTPAHWSPELVEVALKSDTASAVVTANTDATSTVVRSDTASTVVAAASEATTASSETTGSVTLSELIADESLGLAGSGSSARLSSPLSSNLSSHFAAAHASEQPLASISSNQINVTAVTTGRPSQVVPDDNAELHPTHDPLPLNNNDALAGLVSEAVLTPDAMLAPTADVAPLASLTTAAAATAPNVVEPVLAGQDMSEPPVAAISGTVCPSNGLHGSAVAGVVPCVEAQYIGKQRVDETYRGMPPLAIMSGGELVCVDPGAASLNLAKSTPNHGDGHTVPAVPAAVPAVPAAVPALGTARAPASVAGPAGPALSSSVAAPMPSTIAAVAPSEGIPLGITPTVAAPLSGSASLSGDTLFSVASSHGVSPLGGSAISTTVFPSNAAMTITAASAAAPAASAPIAPTTVAHTASAAPLASASTNASAGNYASGLSPSEFNQHGVMEQRALSQNVLAQPGLSPTEFNQFNQSGLTKPGVSQTMGPTPLSALSPMDSAVAAMSMLRTPGTTGGTSATRVMAGLVTGSAALGQGGVSSANTYAGAGGALGAHAGGYGSEKVGSTVAGSVGANTAGGAMMSIGAPGGAIVTGGAGAGGIGGTGAGTMGAAGGGGAGVGLAGGGMVVPGGATGKVKWSDSLVMHILMVAIISLLLMIPTMFFNLVLDDRTSNEQEAIYSIVSPWATSQTLSDPQLIINAQEIRVIEDSDASSRRSYNFKDYFVAPIDAQTAIDMTTQKRFRGNYEASLYRLSVVQEGTFNLKQAVEHILSHAEVDTISSSSIALRFYIKESKGIDEIKFIEVNGKLYTPEPDSESDGFKIVLSGDDFTAIMRGQRLRGVSELNSLPNHVARDLKDARSIIYNTFDKAREVVTGDQIIDTQLDSSVSLDNDLGPSTNLSEHGSDDESLLSEAVAATPVTTTPRAIAALPLISEVVPAGEIHYRAYYLVRGSQEISYIPLAQVSETVINGAGVSPSFVGGFLPREREVDEVNKTFEAWYYQNNLSTGKALIIRDNSRYVFNNDKGYTINVFEGSHFYMLIERLTKYVLLFISMTFVTILSFEIISKRLLSLVQYVIVGIALIMFYMVLLALSEHLSFTLSYVIGALLMSLMIGLYMKAAMKSTRNAVSVVCMLLSMYSVLYAIVHIEAYALLVGTILLVIMLGIVMYITRNINTTGRHFP